MQELNETVGGKLTEFITQINNCYPPEVVEFYSPNYSKTLLQKIDEYQPGKSLLLWLVCLLVCLLSVRLGFMFGDVLLNICRIRTSKFFPIPFHLQTQRKADWRST